jgi:hypothetical protein
MKSLILIIFLTFNIAFIYAQTKGTMNNSKLPFYEIPEAPLNFNAGTVMGRMMDGLGFRYYWATEGLRSEDLDFKPNADARTCFETLMHIKGLSDVIINSLTKKPNIRPTAREEFSFEEVRELTLKNFQAASEILKNSGNDDFKNFELIFESPNETSTYPFWNQINGPIADALWHVGQIVSFRRSSGNPFSNKVSVFNGKIRE